MINVDPWAPLIYKIDYKFDTKQLITLIDTSLSETVENSYLESGNAFSSVMNQFNRPHYWPIVQQFLNELSPSINKILDSWQIERRPWYIGNSWANKHLRGGVTKDHHHGNHVAAVAAYISLPAKSGFIEFKNPLEYHWSQSNLIDHDGKSLWYPVECSSNQVLIFPGWLRHRTQISESDEPRYIMSFNISQREKSN